MVRCPTKVDLERFLDGSLTAEERSQIQTHHDTCDTCRRWVEEARADEDLVPELRRAHATTNGGDDSLAPGLPGGIGLEDTASELSRYRILRRIGGGGMGVVFEAEQQNPKRKVALKVLRPTSMTARALRRFEHECEILGRLEHPSIAKIVEAGTFRSHGEDVPFFAMELIDGQPLVAWARARDLSVRGRIELLLEVAGAVHHAHQRGVVHRDLKPGNILVGADGRPKVLDFGVARSFDAGDAEAGGGTLLSRQGEIVGTLPYMSAEQLAGDPLAVDTRADVYALGVILYELLGGRLPHDLTGCAVPEAIRRVEANTPAPLRSLAPELPEDLEVIAAKALERDKERRYDSAQALADDLRRHLRHEPIEARRPSALYLAGKFVRRNRVLVAGLALTFGALGLGMWTTWNQAERARRAESEARDQAELAGAAEERARLDAERAQRAEEEARRDALAVGELNAFMQSLIGFDPADPDGAKLPADTRLMEIALDAERRLDASELSDPISETSLRIALGNFFSRNGDAARGLTNLEQAHALRIEHLGPLASKTAAASNTLGAAYFAQGRLDEAEERFHAALEGYAAGGDPEDDKRVASTYFNLGVMAQVRGDLDGARDWLERSVELHEATMGPDSIFVTTDLSALGGVLWRAGEREAALETMYEAVAVAERGGHEHEPPSIDAATQLGILLSNAGRHAEAEPVFRRLVELRVETQGEDALETAKARHFLGNVTRDLGRPQETEELARAVIASFRTHLDGIGEKGGDQASIGGELALTLGLLGDALERQERFAEALDAFDESLELHRVHRPGGIHIGSMLASIGHAHLRLGRPAEAEPLLARATAWFGRFAQHKQQTHAVRALADRGAALIALGRAAEARPPLRRALETFARLEDELGYDFASARTLTELDLRTADHALGELTDAGPVRDLRARALAELEATHPAVVQVDLLLGQALRSQGALEEAEQVLERALAAAPDSARLPPAVAPRLRLALAGVRLDASRPLEALEDLEADAPSADLPEDRDQARHLALLGRCLTQLERFDEAEAVLLDCLAGIERFAFDDEPVVQDVLGELVALYEAWGRGGEAEEYRERRR